MSRAGTWAHTLCAGVIVASACSAETVRPDDRFAALRADALARAQVFRTAFRPDVLARGSAEEGEIACRFLPTDATGTTPKFDCELPTGTRVKVKYGNTPEIPAEIAASRLLAALGFGADRVVLARRVRCYGCPASPFYARRVAGWTHLEGLLRRTRNYDAYRDFEWVAIERKLEGAAIEAGGRQGWGFFELHQIDPGRGGAERADVDALRLMAAFLAHWDNKESNQRLVCLPPDEGDDSCRRPLAMLQDVGATFGPRKVDLEAWRSTPVWADVDRCRLSMKRLPHGGSTFEDVEISDRGRRLLADRLSRLSASQIETLFVDARFPGDVEQWVATFRGKVEEITARAPCPG